MRQNLLASLPDNSSAIESSTKEVSHVDWDATPSDPFFGTSSKLPMWTYERKVYWPIFTVAVTVFELIVLLVEFADNGGIEKTAWANVRKDTLVALGAKYGPGLLRGEWWRYFNPMFLHIGILHYLASTQTSIDFQETNRYIVLPFSVNLTYLYLDAALQLLLGFQMEPTLGPWRMATIYIVSGVGGNLLSAVFLPCIVEVGASSSIYGWISIILADLLANWQLYKNPGSKLIIWVVSTLVSLAAGLLPYMDNFAHIGGSISGLFIALMVTPRLIPNQPIWFVRIVGGLMLVMYFVTGFVFFYAGVNLKTYCNWCDLMNCSEVFDACKQLYAEDGWSSCEP